MGQPAARVGDMVEQEEPHCHAPIHPPAPPPTPVPHPPLPLTIIPPCAVTVKIGGMPAARATDQTKPCTEPCVPGGPAIIQKGSATVKICGLPAARVGDPTTHPSCVGPDPGPSGIITGPGCDSVLIGG